MNLTMLKQKIAEKRNGTYRIIRYVSYKSNGVAKHVLLKMRLGVKYENMLINIDKQVGPLPWGKWVSGYEGFLIEYKDKNYLRITSTLCENDKPEVYYTHNDTLISEEEARALTKPSEWNSKPSPVYVVKVENIQAIY